MKICRKCKIEKPIEEFSINKINKDGSNCYRSNCIECNRTYARERYRSFSKEKKTEIYEKRKNYMSYYMSPELQRQYNLKRYGISVFEFEEMLDAQNGKCYICNVDITETKKSRIDHNHKTGKIRKLLCNGCNSGLGHLKENVDILTRCIEYLNEHETLT